MNKEFQATIKKHSQERTDRFSKKSLPETHPETGFCHEKKFLLNQEYYL